MREFMGADGEHRHAAIVEARHRAMEEGEAEIDGAMRAGDPVLARGIGVLAVAVIDEAEAGIDLEGLRQADQRTTERAVELGIAGAGDELVRGMIRRDDFGGGVAGNEPRAGQGQAQAAAGDRRWCPTRLS